MDIEAIVKKHSEGWGECNRIRAALTEADAVLAMEHNFKMLQVEAAHASELRAYEAELSESERKLEVSGYAWSQMGEQLNALRGELAESRERIRQLEAQRAPDGWKLVPIEPTPDMLDAGRWMEYLDVGDTALSAVENDAVEGVWSHMLSAAPAPKEEGE